MTTLEQVQTVRDRLTGVGTLNFKRLRAALQHARGEAWRDAKTSGRSARPLMPFVRSRGTLLCTINERGRCEPNDAGDCPAYKGTKREIVELVTLVETDARYFDVTEIYIEGGYDISDRMDFDDYEPSVSSWELVVWRRGAGYVTPVLEVG